MLISVANIPFPNNQITLLDFTGFLGFVYDAHKDKVYRFGTYTGAKVVIDGFEDNGLKDKSSATITVRY